MVLGKYFILRFSLLVVDMDQTPQSSTLHRLRNVLEMSNRTTPAESQSKQSETEWKTPNKGGYPEHSPRSNAMKWLKSEEAFLTFLLKFHENCCFFKPIFCENFEIAAVQKYANLVELAKCCQTHIFLQIFEERRRGVSKKTKKNTKEKEKPERKKNLTERPLWHP